MLVVAQFPFADVRPFLAVDTRRLARPQMFVRRAGGPAERVGGAPGEIWPAEDEFWTAKQTLRFEPSLDAQRLGPWDRARFACAFRRLFWSELTLPRGRFELGISNAPRGQYPDGREFAPRPDFDGADCVDVLRDFFVSTPIQIASHGSLRRHDVATAGAPLARLLLAATTRWTDAGDFEPAPWWVSAGHPACLVEYGDIERGEPPAHAVAVSDPRAAFELWHYRFRVHARVLPVWGLNIRTPSSPDVRLIRIHVLRLHAETDTFRNVLALLGDEERAECFATSGPRSDALDDYLRKAMGVLSRTRHYGGSSDRLVEAALRYRTVVDSGGQQELVALLERAARRRPLLADLLDTDHPARRTLATTVADSFPEIDEL